jgi:hypothetical protein
MENNKMPTENENIAYSYTKEWRKEYNKKRYEKDKDKIKEIVSKRIICECGCTVVKCKLNTHRKTKKHLKNMILQK